MNRENDFFFSFEESENKTSNLIPITPDSTDYFERIFMFGLCTNLNDLCSLFSLSLSPLTGEITTVKI